MPFLSLQKNGGLAPGTLSVRMEFTSYSMPLISSRFHPRSCLRRGRDGMATKTQGSRPVLFYVAPSGANSNRSNPIQTQIQTKTKTKTKTKFKPSSNPIQTQFKPKFKPKFKPNSNPIRTHLEPKLEIHISSHAARYSEGGSNSRSYRHDELNNQLPSVLFRFCTHNAILFVKH